jgi:apolipoprotein D and lipocalin family protein
VVKHFTIFLWEAQMKHLLKTLAIAGFVVVTTGCNDSVKRDNKSPLQSVRSVDVARYQGTWFVAAKMPAFFEKECRNSRAIYKGVPGSNEVAVTNACESLKEPGKFEVARGTATPVDSTFARLKVTLDRFPGNLFPGDYWVVALDHKNYSWAIVSEPKGRYLWILNRTPKMNKALLGQLVAWVEADGWDVSQLLFDNGNSLQ